MSQPYAAGSLVATVAAASWQKAFIPYTLDGGAPTEYGYGWMLDEIKVRPPSAMAAASTAFAPSRCGCRPRTCTLRS